VICSRVLDKSPRDQAVYRNAKPKIEKEIAAFAATHPDFDELQNDIVKFITAGATLQEAYDKAVKERDGRVPK